jgi:hypothetical protein
MSVVVIFAGLAIRPVFALALDMVLPRTRVSLLIALVGLVAFIPYVAALPVWRMDRDLTDRAAALATVVPKVAAATKPVIADDMTLQLRAGRSVQWEPSIAAELAAMGIYDEAAFVRMIRAGEFAFFVTGGRPGDRWFEEHYNPAVQAAMKDAYPVQQELGEFVLHLPPG